jgi:hypothetical protein
MLDANELQVAIVMMKRAQCTGEEAAPVAVVIQKLTHEFERLTAPKVDVPVVDEE